MDRNEILESVIKEQTWFATFESESYKCRACQHWIGYYDTDEYIQEWYECDCRSQFCNESLVAAWIDARFSEDDAPRYWDQSIVEEQEARIEEERWSWLG